MKIVIIVQARMTSVRLPGKVLKEVLNKPLLEYQIERLKRVAYKDEIIVATTLNNTDQPIVELCNKLLISFYRGPEDDVLSRYYNAALYTNADVIIRVTSDCPIIDPNVIDKTIRFYLDNNSKFDYVSNCLKRTYPRGMDTEVFPFRVLKEAYNEATKKMEREHVTSFIHKQPDRYRLGNFFYYQDKSNHRWTVDMPEDFELIKKIIENLYMKNQEFTLEDVLKMFEEDPNLFLINAHIEQKV